MNARFPALTTISIVLKVFAVIEAIAGVIAALAIHGAPGFAVFVLTVIGVLLLWAFAEIIAVFLAIEDNITGWPTRLLGATWPSRQLRLSPG